MAETLRETAPAPVDTERHEAVITAITHLSDEDTRKLHRYAGLRTLAIQGRVFHAGTEDLLQEAIARTMDGRRKWNPEKVDFATHLMGCIRSIASEYRKDIEMERTYSSERPDRVAALAATETETNEVIQRIRLRLKANKDALRVFDRLRIGYTAAEIKELLGMADGVYDAARKAIYRCIQGMI